MAAFGMFTVAMMVFFAPATTTDGDPSCVWRGTLDCGEYRITCEGQGLLDCTGSPTDHGFQMLMTLMMSNNKNLSRFHKDGAGDGGKENGGFDTKDEAGVDLLTSYGGERREGDATTDGGGGGRAAAEIDNLMDGVKVTREEVLLLELLLDAGQGDPDAGQGDPDEGPDAGQGDPDEGSDAGQGRPYAEADNKTSLFDILFDSEEINVNLRASAGSEDPPEGGAAGGLALDVPRRPTTHHDNVSDSSDSLEVRHATSNDPVTHRIKHDRHTASEIRSERSVSLADINRDTTLQNLLKKLVDFDLPAAKKVLAVVTTAQGEGFTPRGKQEVRRILSEAGRRRRQARESEGVRPTLRGHHARLWGLPALVRPERALPGHKEGARGAPARGAPARGVPARGTCRVFNMSCMEPPPLSSCTGAAAGRCVSAGKTSPRMAPRTILAGIILFLLIISLASLFAALELYRRLVRLRVEPEAVAGDSEEAEMHEGSNGVSTN